MAPRKAEMREAAIAMGKTLAKEGVEVRMLASSPPEGLAGADALIIATGARSACASRRTANSRAHEVD